MTKNELRKLINKKKKELGIDATCDFIKNMYSMPNGSKVWHFRNQIIVICNGQKNTTLIKDGFKFSESSRKHIICLTKSRIKETYKSHILAKNK